MTTQKLFKRRVRERMSRTGESYSAARRHVAVRRERVKAALANPSESPTIDLSPALELASDDKVREATGQGWDAWLSHLDDWGARDRKRGETVDHLIAERGVPSWYAQTITSGFERTRGIRIKHQQADGFTVYASKTVAVPLDVLFDAFADDGLRGRWLTDGSMELRSINPGKIARFDWADRHSRVEVTFESKGPTKALAAVAHQRLADPIDAELAKAAWRGRLVALKAFLESTGPSA